MNIHEHQAKELLRQYNIPTPSGYVAFTTEEAIKVSKKLPGPIFVVKAQIHAGGRGKAGGVKVVKNVDEVLKVALTKALKRVEWVEVDQMSNKEKIKKELSTH